MKRVQQRYVVWYETSPGRWGATCAMPEPEAQQKAQALEAQGHRVRVTPAPGIRGAILG